MDGEVGTTFGELTGAVEGIHDPDTGRQIAPTIGTFSVGWRAALGGRPFFGQDGVLRAFVSKGEDDELVRLLIPLGPYRAAVCPRPPGPHPEEERSGVLGDAGGERMIIGSGHSGDLVGRRATVSGSDDPN
jgi:hypothetical protein